MATFSTLAQYHMDNGDHMDGGWGWAMAALMILVVLAVVALVVWLVRSNSGSHAHIQASPASTGAGSESPMQILDRRLAEGEITPDEYHERAAILAKR
jgi:putative membrane protein